MTRRYQRLLLCAVFSIGSASAVAAEEPSVPQTAQAHRDLAARYDQKASAAREEAAQHRAMVEAAYKAELHSKAPIRRKFEQMRRHCKPIIRDAERLADDLETFAAWHRLQAAESP